MADELQGLIERIQRDGVEKAAAAEAEIIARAKEQAAEIVKTAQTKSAAILKQAEKDAEVFTERSRKTLTQAARDVLIACGAGLNAILEETARQSVGQALTPETMQSMLARIVEAFAAQGLKAGNLTVLLNPEDQRRLAGLLASGLNNAMAQGVELRPNDRIAKGFRVAVRDGHVSHDFTEAALAESMCALLKPQLAEIVYRVAQKTADAAQKTGN